VSTKFTTLISPTTGVVAAAAAAAAAAASVARPPPVVESEGAVPFFSASFAAADADTPGLRHPRRTVETRMVRVRRGSVAEVAAAREEPEGVMLDGREEEDEGRLCQSTRAGSIYCARECSRHLEVGDTGCVRGR
jgi:hypothetical protein